MHHALRRGMLSADPAASQLRAVLDANRSKRKTKWTTDAEIGLLTEFWGRMARRDARAFSFVFKEQQLAGPVRKVFSEQAVKQKLKLLKQELPAEIYAWPAHTPADEVEAMFPVYKLLADARGRQQVGRRCTQCTAANFRGLRLCAVRRWRAPRTTARARGSKHQCGMTSKMERCPTKRHAAQPPLQRMDEMMVEKATVFCMYDSFDD